MKQLYNRTRKQSLTLHKIYRAIKAQINTIKIQKKTDTVDDNDCGVVRTRAIAGILLSVVYLDNRRGCIIN